MNGVQIRRACNRPAVRTCADVEVIGRVSRAIAFIRHSLAREKTPLNTEV